MASDSNGDRARGILARGARIRRELNIVCNEVRDLQEVVTEHDARLDEIEAALGELPTRRR
jgi:hypothetical protein